MVSNIWSVCIFFFSSRRRHTRYWRDWSSDVCSSDLPGSPAGDYSPDWSPDGDALVFVSDRDDPEGDVYRMAADGTEVTRLTRSEERRVGKSVDLGGRRIIKKKKTKQHKTLQCHVIII